MGLLRPSSLGSWLVALGVMTAPAAAPAAETSITMTGAPAGFADLEQPRELLVDVYFGKRKIGDAWISARPGFVKFRDPARVLGLIPELKPSAAAATRLASDLDDHSALACSGTNSESCGMLAPELVDVIFNESRFQVELFVHPSLLGVARPRDPYLATPTAPFSLTSSLGGAIAGSVSGPTSYNFQNRTIIGLKNGRIRSDSAIASGLGFIVDDLVAEVDTKRHRYSGGLFWAPGVDFTGRRRIAGFGFSTQFDTRADSEDLKATPLILFLSQPSRVEVLIDGRLVTSGSYEAGNTQIDSAALPSGSYLLVLRVREPSGNVREERRFFVKNAAIPPVGQPIYFAYAGLLANTRRNQPISLSKSFYYQVGMARRLNETVAVDVAVFGTEKKAIAQVGGWLIASPGRIRAAALASSDGDAGVLLQAASSGFGRLNLNFDLRRVWSRKGGPLIPLPSHIDNFGSVPPIGAQVSSGSYTQATGSLSYSLGEAILGLTGSYRRDRGQKADYSIGPSLTWPIFRSGGLQLILNVDAQRGRRTTAAFAGFRLLYTSGGYSTLATTGYGSLKSKDDGRKVSRQVGSLSAQWFHQDEDRTQVALEGALQRDVETTTARANAQVATRFGIARAEVLQSLEGRKDTQYGLNFQTGLAVGGNALEVGGRDLNQSAIIASLDGSAGDAAFDILIDDVPRGRVAGSSRLPIFLEAYRSYRLRLRPIGAVPISYDSGTRVVSLFPGNVEHLKWSAEALTTMFGQAVRENGKPVANASITLRSGIGQTDENGYFQVDAAANEVLTFQSGETICKVALAGVQMRSDYAKLGRVVCK